jgi:hypothetical protein
MARVPNSAEGGLSDKEHQSEAEMYAYGFDIDGVKVERGRKSANPYTNRYDSKSDKEGHEGVAD